MAYSPTGSVGTAEFLDRIAERVTKDIRHMDVISHDPEAQRIKRLIVAACQESFALALPRDDGMTRHVTSDKDIQFTVKGQEGLKDGKIVQEAMPAHHIAVCKICSAVHNPRGTYDHAAEPLRKTG